MSIRQSAMRHLPTTITRLLYLLLLGCLSATAQGLRDSGYGDGSLVDPTGNYYYPQRDGGYVDAYGSSYSPIGEGLYTDALGNMIESPGDAVNLDPDHSDHHPVASAGPDENRQDFQESNGTEAPRDPQPAGPQEDPVTDPLQDGSAVGQDHHLRSSHGKTAAARRGSSPNDPLNPGETEEFGSMYLEDVGTGYLSGDEK